MSPHERGQTPLWKLHRNPEIHVSTGRNPEVEPQLQMRISAPEATGEEPERSLTTDMETGLPRGHTSDTLWSS